MTQSIVRFAQEVLGVELWPEQAAILQEWEASGKRKALWALGRRSGKSLMAAIVAIHDAIVPDFSAYLRPGETRYVLAVATREAQAQELIRTIRELLEQAVDPELAQMIEETTSLEIRLAGPVIIRALPCNSRATRGMAASMVIFDEFAFFNTDTEGGQAAKSVWRALVPSTMQFGDRARVLVTSSPNGPHGWFHELFEAGAQGRDQDLQVAQRATWEVNPTITRESLQGEFAADPQGAAAEYAAEFVENTGNLLDPVAIQACIVQGRRVLPPRSDRTYVGWQDPAFAAGGDSYALAIGHAEGTGDDKRAVIDLVKAWRGTSGPLSSDTVLDEVAQTLKSYGLSKVGSDQFSVEPIKAALKRRSITVDYTPTSSERKADAYARLRQAVNLGQIDLLDDPELHSELVGLRITSTPVAGKPRIQAGHGHDDRATVVAGVCFELLGGHRLTDPAAIAYVTEVHQQLNPASAPAKPPGTSRPGTGAQVGRYVPAEGDLPTGDLREVLERRAAGLEGPQATDEDRRNRALGAWHRGRGFGHRWIAWADRGPWPGSR